jgi:uncharacterized protein YukE
MAEIIQMNFEHMQEAAKAFSDAAKALEQTQSGVIKIGGMYSDDGLVGDAGERLVEICNGLLPQKIGALAEAFEEMSKDINDAMKAMQDTDSNVTRYY